MHYVDHTRGFDRPWAFKWVLVRFKNSPTDNDKILSKEKERESRLWIMSTGFLAQALGPINMPMAQWIWEAGRRSQQDNWVAF